MLSRHLTRHLTQSLPAELRAQFADEEAIRVFADTLLEPSRAQGVAAHYDSKQAARVLRLARSAAAYTGDKITADLVRGAFNAVGIQERVIPHVNFAR